jgi:hypothetical protein
VCHDPDCADWLIFDVKRDQEGFNYWRFDLQRRKKPLR